MSDKNKMSPIIMTVLIIIIIIYLFATIKQPDIKCSNSINDNLGINIKEEISSKLEGNKLQKIELKKEIILPENYLKNDKYLDSIKFSLEKSYDYLDKEKVKVTKKNDRVVATILIDKNETIILNNIEFLNTNDLQIKINTNTKSNDVITFSIGDNYTEGELMARMRNNGYSCK